ncbi:TPA: DEAD/DEAH box helicase [Candidatus Woesearchaeota archaeon]|nr:DEAD/DEAH box helicase [Candidatus Woesearchaeota archaeon]
MIKDFEPRLYQQTIFSEAIKQNTLVVLPTGLGKTNIFLMVAAHRLRHFPSHKILLIGPTKPLVDQYIEVFRNHFDIEEHRLAVFTGLVRPERREELWKSAQVIFSTPQGLENDIIAKRVNLSEVSLLGIDEAHRATGDYAYVFVAKQYQKIAQYPRIIAMTASPGSDMEKITEICQNLFIEHIEVRNDNDHDVAPYIQETNVEHIAVRLPPPFFELQKSLAGFLNMRMQKLKSLGLLKQPSLSHINKTDLLKLSAVLRGEMARGAKGPEIWQGLSVLAEVLKMQHALELAETQGVIPTYHYLNALHQESFTTTVKAVKNIASDIHFREALIKANQLVDEGIEHPKLVELQRIIESEAKQEGFKAIVFNQYRDNALDVTQKLMRIEGVRASIFVGQAKKGDTGFSQKQQKEILEKFRKGEFNVLVATSIAEEGLDIPNVDLVIFYEPIPSAIRSIQRRGRTGRHGKGKVIILETKGTRDEGYRWSAIHKERRMRRNLDELKRVRLEKPAIEQRALTEKEQQEKPMVYVDYRERSSGLVKDLMEAGFEIKLEQLQTGDYLLSSRVGIEFKTVQDFVDSLVDGRLLEQLKNLKQQFERPIIVIEGDADIYSVRNVHPNAIRGLIATIAVSYAIPILFTKSGKETAHYFMAIARREQQEGKQFSPHFEKRSIGQQQAMEYIVSSFPGVGTALAKPLLRHFMSIKKIVNAKTEQLESVEKIGPKKAKALRDIFDAEYSG